MICSCSTRSLRIVAQEKTEGNNAPMPMATTRLSRPCAREQEALGSTHPLLGFRTLLSPRSYSSSRSGPYLA